MATLFVDRKDPTFGTIGRRMSFKFRSMRLPARKSHDSAATDYKLTLSDVDLKLDLDAIHDRMESHRQSGSWSIRRWSKFPKRSKLFRPHRLMLTIVDRSSHQIETQSVVWQPSLMAEDVGSAFWSPPFVSVWPANTRGSSNVLHFTLFSVSGHKLKRLKLLARANLDLCADGPKYYSSTFQSGEAKVSTSQARLKLYPETKKVTACSLGFVISSDALPTLTSPSFALAKSATVEKRPVRKAFTQTRPASDEGCIVAERQSEAAANGCLKLHEAIAMDDDLKKEKNEEDVDITENDVHASSQCLVQPATSSSTVPKLEEQPEELFESQCATRASAVRLRANYTSLTQMHIDMRESFRAKKLQHTKGSLPSALIRDSQRVIWAKVGNDLDLNFNDLSDCFALCVLIHCQLLPVMTLDVIKRLSIDTRRHIVMDVMSELDCLKTVDKGKQWDTSVENELDDFVCRLLSADNSVKLSPCVVDRIEGMVNQYASDISNRQPSRPDIIPQTSQYRHLSGRGERPKSLVSSIQLPGVRCEESSGVNGNSERFGVLTRVDSVASSVHHVDWHSVESKSHQLSSTRLSQEHNLDDETGRRRQCSDSSDGKVNPETDVVRRKQLPVTNLLYRRSMNVPQRSEVGSLNRIDVEAVPDCDVQRVSNSESRSSLMSSVQLLIESTSRPASSCHGESKSPKADEQHKSKKEEDDDDELETQLRKLDEKTVTVEARIVDLRQQLSAAEQDSSSDGLVDELLRLVAEKDEIVRRQMELNMMQEQRDIERRQSQLVGDLHHLASVPEIRKTEAMKMREDSLLKALVAVVDERDQLLSRMDAHQASMVESADVSTAVLNSCTPSSTPLKQGPQSGAGLRPHNSLPFNIADFTRHLSPMKLLE